jgi:hypothetical protein
MAFESTHFPGLEGAFLVIVIFDRRANNREIRSQKVKTFERLKSMTSPTCCIESSKSALRKPSNRSRYCHLKLPRDGLGCWGKESVVTKRVAFREVMEQVRSAEMPFRFLAVKQFRAASLQDCVTQTDQPLDRRTRMGHLPWVEYP